MQYCAKTSPFSPVNTCFALKMAKIDVSTYGVQQAGTLWEEPEWILSVFKHGFLK